MTALEIVEAAADGPVLVAGSLPPQGRDLDLLAPRERLNRLEDALAASGFVEQRGTWARFEPLELVDLDPLPDPGMLARATPLPGHRHVCVPDPADALRLTARSYARDRRMTPGRRARADVPAAMWAEAAARGDASELRLLEQATTTEPPTPDLVRRVRGRVSRMRSAGVITLSGVDGSGKSTQAERLQASLATAGVETVVVWHRLSHDGWLDRLARPVKRLLRRGRAGESVSTGTAQSPEPVERGGTAANAPRGTRNVWIVLVAVANALTHLRTVRRHTLAGRLVISDRYVLDSIVQLHSDYPAGPGRWLGIWLVRALSPRPRASFLLAVPGEMARARKPWSGPVEQLERHVQDYAVVARRLSVVHVDGTRPLTEIADQIARETWRRL
ncbi:dTMP kinase [Nocardioides sp.]|uniref:dTMP kinase n=1 Tax=Nocardioides sp. TaxID=35761 RepID=UPI0035642E26